MVTASPMEFDEERALFKGVLAPLAAALERQPVRRLRVVSLGEGMQSWLLMFVSLCTPGMGAAQGEVQLLQRLGADGGRSFALAAHDRRSRAGPTMALDLVGVRWTRPMDAEAFWAILTWLSFHEIRLLGGARIALPSRTNRLFSEWIPRPHPVTLVVGAGEVRRYREGLRGAVEVCS